MKVRIQNRSVYHKFVEVEVEIPNDVEDVQQYLVSNEHLYVDKIDKAMDETSLVFGTGLYDFDGMDDAETDSEWRYEIVGQNSGGHL